MIKPMTVPILFCMSALSAAAAEKAEAAVLTATAARCPLSKVGQVLSAPAAARSPSSGLIASGDIAIEPTMR
jgi:hypothetical protein